MTEEYVITSDKVDVVKARLAAKNCSSVKNLTDSNDYWQFKTIN